MAAAGQDRTAVALAKHGDPLQQQIAQLQEEERRQQQQQQQQQQRSGR